MEPFRATGWLWPRPRRAFLAVAGLRIAQFAALPWVVSFIDWATGDTGLHQNIVLATVTSILYFSGVLLVVDVFRSVLWRNGIDFKRRREEFLAKSADIREEMDAERRRAALARAMRHDG